MTTVRKRPGQCLRGEQASGTAEDRLTPSVGGEPPSPAPLFAAVTALFFLSGAVGLVYQVLWMRRLGLFFGSDMFGVSIILSVFMGGLALGSVVGGYFAERVTRPLAWYGVAELGIGTSALLVAPALRIFDPLLHTAYVSAVSGSVWAYQLMRVLLAIGALLIPTAFMGATLPLLMRQFVHRRGVLGEMAAFLYAANTLGAMAGTLLAGFLLLPYLGMTIATSSAAALNFGIAMVCLLLGFQQPGLSARAAGASRDLDPLPGLDAPARQRVARAALLAFGVSGFGSFALEVVWTRILVISVSGTVYSFASMLACVLFGIFLGSILVARRVDRDGDPLRLFAALEIAVGVSTAVLCLLVNAVPTLFGTVLSALVDVLPGVRGEALVIATLATSYLLLAIPTTLLGATFSVALRAYTTSIVRVGSRTGNLYFANTLGAILGSLCAGIALVPTIGTKASLALVACLFAINGVYLILARPNGRVHDLSQPAVALPVLAVLVATAIGVCLPYRVTLNFNQRADTHTELLFHADGVQNTIDVTRSRSGVTSLIIGGNVEADDSVTQRRHFVLKAHLPLLLLERPQSILVVGLGMGITLQATLRHPGVERVDVVELSPEILEAQAHLREINGDVARDPRVRIRIDDGRGYAKLTDAHYDMITADPIHPKISRVGYLYTKEYYQLIRSRLAPGGVVCQWMPLYQISPTRLRSAVKTFLEVFPSATLWYVKNHALLIATRDSALIDFSLLAEKFRDPAVRQDLHAIGIDSPEELLSLLLMGPRELQAFVSSEPDVPINTDDYPYLEYFVPGDLFYKPIDNVRALIPYLADPTELTANQSATSVAATRAFVEGRATRLIDDLK